MKRNYNSKYRGYEIISVKTADKNKRWLSKKGDDEFYTPSFVEAMNTVDDRLEEQKLALKK